MAGYAFTVKTNYNERMDRHVNRSSQTESSEQHSYIGPIPRKQSPVPMSASPSGTNSPLHPGHNHANATSTGAGKNTANAEYVLFENLSRGISASDGEISVFSLANIPSPLSHNDPGATPYSTTNHNNSYHHHSKSSNRHARQNNYHDDEDDTFYDDRSLEHRIKLTLTHAPQPFSIDTPQSVPVTPKHNNHTNSPPRHNAQGELRQPKPSMSLLWNDTRQSISSNSLPSSHQDENNTGGLNSIIADDEGDHQIYNNNSEDDNDKIRTQRSAMAIVKLKQNLRNAVNNLYFTKQEKESVERRLRQLQEKIDEMVQDKIDAKVHRVTSDKQLKTKHTQYISLCTEVNAKQQDLQQSQVEAESLRRENHQLSSRILSLICEHKDDWNSLCETTEARIVRLSKQLKQAHKEIKRLTTTLENTKCQNAKCKKELNGKESQSQADLFTMTEKFDACRLEIQRMESIIQEARTKSLQYIRQLETQREEFKVKHDADQIEIIRLRHALKDTGKETSRGSTNTSSADIEIANLKKQKESQERKTEQVTVALQAAKESLDQIRGELKQAKEEKQIQVRENGRLGDALKEAKQRVKEQEGDTYKHAACQANFEGGMTSFSSATTGQGNTTTDSIMDRLARIRDAALRASLVKEHHREIARLKAQQEARIKNITSRHELHLEETINSTKSQIDAKNKDSVEALEHDFHARLATIEKRHHQEVGQVRFQWLCCALHFIRRFTAFTMQCFARFSCKKISNTALGFLMNPLL